ncbi:hypothetical protein LSUE1_G009555 [Lachnellula suecica]|uniref:Gfd2/YDR514C-like C-terminal domain-containing protein n=1 Tax=Lachnellula suecica TaxID=602035 RepID=A0A8T9BV92_9HELO|nr:hypothetical protein LSUE1_G009555 [Lachnellula suecica]
MKLPQWNPALSATYETRPALKGKLREDLLALRHIFGLDLGRQPLGRSLGHCLPGSLVKDLLIVAIDVENPMVTQLEGDTHYEVGISILDTRDMQSSIQDERADSKKSFDLLQTHQYCVGPEKYYKRVIWRYPFGDPKHTFIEVVRSRIKELIRGRDVILVVHGGRWDLEFLRAASINLKPLYTIDTQKAAQHPLDLEYRIKSEQLLDVLDMSPFEPGLLHVAGNDANFTLRALLLIACLDVCSAPQLLEPAQLDLLFTLEQVARGPIFLDFYHAEAEIRLRRKIKLQKKEENRKRAKERIRAKELRDAANRSQ